MPNRLLETALLIFTSCIWPYTSEAEEIPNWQVSMASLWGKTGDQQLKGVIVNKDGLVIAGGSGGAVVPAPIINDIGSGGSGVLIVYDPDIGEVVSLSLIPGNVSDMDQTPDGDLLVAAGGSVYRLNSDGSEMRWQAPGGGRIASDGKGGVWVGEKRTIRHINAEGEETISFSSGTGWGNKDIAYDPKTDHVFVAGSRSARGPKSGNPVHIPWLFAYNSTGKHVWTAYNFSSKDIEAVGDMADSHITRLHVNSQGKVFFYGDAEGGNTPYRHDTLKVGGKIDANKGSPLAGNMWKAFSSRRVLYVGQLNAATGAIEKGSFFYGLGFNEAKKREEVGDADAHGLYADDDGRVYLTGVIRAKPPGPQTPSTKTTAHLPSKAAGGTSLAPTKHFWQFSVPDSPSWNFALALPKVIPPVTHHMGWLWVETAQPLPWWVGPNSQMISVKKNRPVKPPSCALLHKGNTAVAKMAMSPYSQRKKLNR